MRINNVLALLCWLLSGTAALLRSGQDSFLAAGLFWCLWAGIGCGLLRDREARR